MDPDDPNMMLTDFLVFLGKERLVETQRMPSGYITYGRAYRSLDAILNKYWETYG